MECPICLEEIKPDFVENDGLHLPCHHNFHRSCAEQWFARLGLASCPMCRRCLLEDDALRYELSCLISHASWKRGLSAAQLAAQRFRPVWQWCQKERQIYDRYTRVRALINAGQTAALEALALQCVDD